MTSSHAGTPQARAKIHTTLTDFEIALLDFTIPLVARYAEAVVCGYACQHRDVAQLGSARRSGRRGRRFKSCHPDQISPCHH